MFDFDLAQMYGVETRALKQAVRRNLTRFPKDFMFVLNRKEVTNLVSQNVIPSKSMLGGATPMVFTEQGVSMLSSVLKSRQAGSESKYFYYAGFCTDAPVFNRK